MLIKWAVLGVFQLLTGIIATSSSPCSFSASISDSSLTLLPSTQKYVSLTSQTMRDEDLVIWKSLFSIPEFVQSLFNQFSAFESDAENENFLWPKLAAVAALSILERGGDDLIDELITARFFSVNTRIVSTSQESLLDVWDAIIGSLPESIVKLFRFSKENSCSIRTIILQDRDNVDVLQHFTDYLDRLSKESVSMPVIMAFGIERVANEEGKRNFAINIPSYLHVGGNVYERVVSILPSDNSNHESPYACWIKNRKIGNWDLMSCNEDASLILNLDGALDTETVIVLYRLEAVTLIDLKIPERLVEYAMKQLAPSPLQSAVFDAGSLPLVGALLVSLLGDQRLIESFNKFDLTHSRTLVQFYHQLMRGESINFVETDLLQYIYDKIPTELATYAPTLWIQMCRLVFPVDAGIQLQYGTLIHRSFAFQRSMSASIIVIAPNDHVGIAHGHLAITYKNLQTRLIPTGSAFAIGVNRVPVRGADELAANLDISELNNDLAKVVAFVCLDPKRGGYYTFFAQSRNWVRYQSGSAFDFLPQIPETQSLIQQELAEKSIFILFHYSGDMTK
jgi:hypothetical protein